VHLAIFDLDNTLLDGDSDYLWGRFLVQVGLVDSERYEQGNRRFYEDYMAGTLDIRAFLRFSLTPLRRVPMDELHTLRRRFVDEVVRPRVLPAARELIEQHRRRGDRLLIITATNSFVTGPIAELLGVGHLLATEPEMADGHFTGEIAGTPAFQGGKLQRLHQWLSARPERFEQRWFYSDSRNDLPLLEAVDHPVGVDPDAELERIARQRDWPVVSLRSDAGRRVFERVAEPLRG